MTKSALTGAVVAAFGGFRCSASRRAEHDCQAQKAMADLTAAS